MLLEAGAREAAASQERNPRNRQRLSGRVSGTESTPSVSPEAEGL